MGFREVKRNGRRALHQAMRVPAYYIASLPFSSADEDELKLVHVRVHTKFTPLGDQAGTNFNSAEREDVTPKIIFERSEIQPVRGAVVSVAAEEAYRIERTLPNDGDFVTAHVVALDRDEAFGLPVPD